VKQGSTKEILGVERAAGRATASIKRKDCEKLIKATHRRDEFGHYMMQLPFKKDVPLDRRMQRIKDLHLSIIWRTVPKKKDVLRLLMVTPSNILLFISAIHDNR